jgi:hypothetical protein
MPEATANWLKAQVLEAGSSVFASDAGPAVTRIVLSHEGDRQRKASLPLGK